MPSGIQLEFEIKAFNPDTIPMARLAEYMSDLAKLLGAERDVHFIAVRKGSTKIVHRVASEAFPTIRERTYRASDPDAPEDIRTPYQRIEQRLRRDNAKGARLTSPDGKLFEIRISHSALEYSAISKHDQLRGVVTRIGGRGEWVPVHLEDITGTLFICEARKEKTKELSRYYLGQPIVVSGLARWHRKEKGGWELENFRIHDFAPLVDRSVQQTIATLRDINTDWQRRDYLAEMHKIREGNGTE